MLLLSTLASLALSGTALASSPAAYFDAPKRTGGYEKISAKFYIDPASVWRTGYYAATNPTFEGHDGLYFGLQPRSASAYTGRVVFSVFGKGTAIGDPARCSGGADGGSGTSCALNEIDLHAGQWYDIRAEVVERGPLGRRWNGTLTHEDGRETYIASFWTDDSFGGLSGRTTQWLEWYKFNSILATTTPEQRECQPYFDATYGTPVWYADGQAIKATNRNLVFNSTIDDKCAVAANDPNYKITYNAEGQLNIKGGIHTPR